MDANELRALQAPFKKQYREQTETARTPAQAEGMLDLDRVACRVRSCASDIRAGPHPATGGDGNLACSADMLLETLVACAGVTMSAVATVIGVKLRAMGFVKQALRSAPKGENLWCRPSFRH